MSILFFTGYILSTVLFMQLFRVAQHRQVRVLSVAAANYFVAAFCAYAWWQGYGGHLSETLPLWLGLGNGLIYWTHLLVFLVCYQLVGVGVTVAVMSCSCVAPVLLAAFFWSEPMGTGQWAAVAMVPAVIVLLTPASLALETKKAMRYKSGWLLLNLLMGSSSAALHKAVDIYVRETEKPVYNMALFGGAALCGVIYLLIKHIRPTRVEWSMGLKIGLVNILTLITLLGSLSVLSTTTVFPIGGVLIILVNLAVSHHLWKEKLSRKQILGILLAVLVVLLGQ